jgi:glycerophosphoryl diester phosphodiesterase
LTEIYGHRGARGERPENTIEAVHLARSLGLAGIECDIALTRDLVPVLHHDPDIAAANFIRDMDFEQLHRQLPHIPTLAQALQAAPRMQWLIEIKTFPNAPEKTWPPAVMAEAVLAVLENQEKSEQACILAFDWRVLSAVAVAAPELRRVCLTAPETEQARVLWWGEDIIGAVPDAVARVNAHAWAPFHANLTISEIERAQHLGLRVFPWTVNEPSEFARLAPIVDGIITDFPSRIGR